MATEYADTNQGGLVSVTHCGLLKQLRDSKHKMHEAPGKVTQRTILE